MVAAILLAALLISMAVNGLFVMLMRLSGPIVAKEAAEATRGAVLALEEDVRRLRSEWAGKEDEIGGMIEEARNEFGRAERKRASAAAAASRANGPAQADSVPEPPTLFNP